MRRQVLVVMILAASALVLFHSPVPAQSADHELADLYFRHARRLQEQDQIEESLRVAEIGLEYNDLSSDLLTLYAELQLLEPAGTGRAVETLERALLQGRFKRMWPDDGVTLLASVLIRTGEYEDALGWIEDYARDRRSPEVLYHEARALIALERFQTADARIATGLNRYPEEARFVRLAVGRDPLPGFSVARWLDEYRDRRDDPEFLRVLLHYARSLESGDKQQRRLEQYFGNGGEDPFAVVAYLPYSDKPEEQLEQFREVGGFETREALAAFFAQLPDGSVRHDLERELAEFSGAVYGERDAYGYPRERLIYETGRLVQYAYDPNRDGVYEHLVMLQDGLPTLYRRSDSSIRSTVVYNAYPEVRSMLRREPDRNEFRYVLARGRFRFPVIRFGEEWFTDTPQILAAISIDRQREIPSAEVLRRHAARIEERRPDAERAHEITYMEKGEVYRVVTDSTHNGRIDLIVEYQEGKPFFGLRDVTGDGYFELLKRYRAGVLAEVAVDENRDGVYTYFEEPGPPVRVSWDLVQDGRIDVRETYCDDELVGREYRVAPSVWPDVREISPWSVHGSSEELF